MKTQYVFGCILSAFLLLGGCKSSPLEKRATGLAYEVVVTTDFPIWNGDAGNSLKNELQSDVPGLPGSEPSMRVTYAQPKDFNGLLTYVRNILIVKVNPAAYSKVSLSFENDTWANGQTVVTLTSPATDSIVSYLKENPRIIVNHFTKVEMGRAEALLEKTYSPLVMENVKNKFGYSLKAPETMTFVGPNATDFFWTSNNAPTGRTDMIIYTFPYADPNTFTLEYLVNKRDSVLKVNMPGSFPGSYMTTETRFPITTYTPITVNGKYCGVLRGLWRVQGDMMGGPFVSHVRLDETNNRVVVVEGFVYSPESDKRNYIRRIESSLYTLRLPGEFQ